MINDMTVRGLPQNTKLSYLRSVTGLARHYRRSPDQITAPEVQDYLLFLHQKRGLSWKSCNCVRFLFRTTLGVPDPHFYVSGAKTPSTLPEILNHDELVRLFSLFTVTTNPKHRALLITAYAARLRASELGRLQVKADLSERLAAQSLRVRRRCGDGVGGESTHAGPRGRTLHRVHAGASGRRGRQRCGQSTRALSRGASRRLLRRPARH